MFSSKKNILQVVALLKAYDIKHIVLSPGSRNAPLIETICGEAYFKTYSIVDERSAAFFALGLIQKRSTAVAICCTSGSALTNYAPAVSEAFYQKLPLVVISADRPPAWIGQMDGQTIPQRGFFGSLVRKSIQLPEIHQQEDEWFCNRLINEALTASTYRGLGPVHINIPISEPLFDFSVQDLPKARRIESIKLSTPTLSEAFGELWTGATKRMLLFGQMPPAKRTQEYAELLAKESGCLVLKEHLSNISTALAIANFDAILAEATEEEQRNLAPDFLITMGGHIVSKRIKQFLRKHPPRIHCNVCDDGQIVDLFQCLSHTLETDDIASFLQKLYLIENPTRPQTKYFAQLWQEASTRVKKNIADGFTPLQALSCFAQHLPPNAAVQVANSSSVRNLQHFSLAASNLVYCNRGVSGIEGSLSTALGYASQCSDLCFLVIGDLSFFYDLNALFTSYLQNNFRILLINNGGGGIFNSIEGLENTQSLEQYIVARHSNTAKDIALAAGLTYLSANDNVQLEQNMRSFVSPSHQKAVLLEVVLKK